MKEPSTRTLIFTHGTTPSTHTLSPQLRVGVSSFFFFPLYCCIRDQPILGLVPSQVSAVDATSTFVKESHTPTQQRNAHAHAGAQTAHVSHGTPVGHLSQALLVGGTVDLRPVQAATGSSSSSRVGREDCSEEGGRGDAEKDPGVESGAASQAGLTQQ